jgi:two-component system, chemotaxis family, chemotaxis protein CheY
VSKGSYTVVLVGHCGPDSWALKSAVGSAIPGARVVSANDQPELERAMETADLLLVNRQLDGAFDADSGADLIRAIRAAKGPGAMLISNFPEAQAEAEAAGALPGFGKTAMYAAETKRRLRAALGLE